MTERNVRAAVDIGGTFTDLVMVDADTGEMIEAKASTTPDDFTVGVLNTLTTSGADLRSISYLVHGTTVVINAITQRTGVPTALVTTKGFRDALEIRRGNRPDMYNLKFHKPPPFVPRRLRFELNERISAKGEVLESIHLDELDAIAKACRQQDVRAIAICFLHSYAYPEHEQQAKRYLAELLPDVAISCSSEITKEWREYERSSTAVLNAYVQPILAEYLSHFNERVATGDESSRRFAMLSNGGTATFDMAARQPIQLVESGPAGGIIGAAVIGRQTGDDDVISLDIGGTTAKCSLIEDGEVKISGDYRLEWTPQSPGYPVRIPVVDIVEIGAGGGSIVWFDAGGSLQIGPRSAGAVPGPACYGNGGIDPTITDAMVLAGVLAPESFLGGRLPISVDLARQSFEPIAQRLGLSIDDTVAGVLRLFHQVTVDALKLVSVRRGHDPRDFSLVAFGGGGPVHAGALGLELDVKRVIVPPFPGTFSSWGMLHTDPRLDQTRTQVQRLSEIDAAAIEHLFAELEAEAAATLRDQCLTELGMVSHQRALDMRYHGQEHTVRVPVPDGPVSIDSLVQSFNQLHKKAYTFALEQTPIELVNYRTTSIVKLRANSRANAPAVPSLADPKPVKRRRVRFGGWEEAETPVYDRAKLPPGFTGLGPAIVEEASATTVVSAGQAIEVDRHGNLILWSPDRS